MFVPFWMLEAYNNYVEPSMYIDAIIKHFPSTILLGSIVIHTLHNFIVFTVHINCCYLCSLTVSAESLSDHMLAHSMEKSDHQQLVDCERTKDFASLKVCMWYLCIYCVFICVHVVFQIVGASNFILDFTFQCML